MSPTPRDAAQERAYWDREMNLVERENARDQIRQQNTNLQAAVFNETVRAIRSTEWAITFVVLLILAIVAFGLVKLGIYVYDIV